MKRPLTYAEALARPSRAVWPGCGDGRCRSCGRVHDFSYRTWTGQIAHRFLCWQNHVHGCPQPIPEPALHRWRNGYCAVCGAKEPWVAPDGRRYSTLEEARRHGWRRHQLVRESSRAGSS